MAVSRDEVFGVLQGIVPRLEEALPGWSARPNITGTGAVGLYLDGPNLPLAGVNVDGESVARHLCGTIQTADRGLPQELGQVRVHPGCERGGARERVPRAGRPGESGGTELDFCAEGTGGSSGVRGA